MTASVATPGEERVAGESGRKLNSANQAHRDFLELLKL